MNKRSPDSVDIYVGKRLKELRGSMSQEKLAKKLGITFQQIQKYENGKNRISAGRLYYMSQILNVDIQDFFQEYEEIQST